ncbi:alpha beta-hydrolase [Coniophora puteana RWD-64-598 SS2]|uniref:Carboxylic ester hydrolase n=1 Tax=Coniophora puteana (strain RWD-64-598) TaxID=741705 RepID=A0A5M3MMC6_CONPW|nr:alpha beta-hydrolase [Coniophora puteana RWD-64-598 SS2]EIW79934.1 alpha beta-hydrolase [Coniophora puteana RWD-64-598 SS2]
MLRLGFVLASLALSAFGQGTVNTTVDLGYATYLGNQTMSNVVAYLGVPYAEPPVGNSRFRAPAALNTSRIAAEAGGKVVNVQNYPDFCVQGAWGLGDRGGAGSEDCLKVNIWTPAGAKEGDNLPVLVYIHGGAYLFGNPAAYPFDPWVQQSPNVIIASIYYRLDSLGFLASPAWTSDSTLGDFNAGFLDQVESLKWIQRYISKFGGDPSRVTINGESAGASSVELHMTSTVSRGLFQQVIAQSVYRTPLPTLAQQEPLFDFYAQQAGCGTGSAADVMTCLRAVDVSALAGAQDAASINHFNGSKYTAWRPVLDGKIFADYPTAVLQSGAAARVSVIAGATSNETLAAGATIQQGLRAYFPQLTDGGASAVAAAYPDGDVTDATGDASLRCGREALAGFSAQKNKAWTYRYNQPIPGTPNNSVNHAAENWMLFQGSSPSFNGSLSFTPQTPVELTFTSEVIAYWLSFVRSGDPNTYKLAMSPAWDAWTADAPVRVVLQQDQSNSTTVSGSYMEPQPDVETKGCQVDFGQVEDQQN